MSLVTFLCPHLPLPCTFCSSGRRRVNQPIAINYLTFSSLIPLLRITIYATFSDSNKSSPPSTTTRMCFFLVVVTVAAARKVPPLVTFILYKVGSLFVPFFNIFFLLKRRRKLLSGVIKGGCSEGEGNAFLWYIRSGK